MNISIKSFHRGLLLLLLLFATQIVAAQKVTINYSNTPLSIVLKAIAKQSQLELAYSESSVDLSEKVSVSTSNEQVETVLQKVLANKPLTFSIQNGKIYLMSKNMPQEAKEGALINISGRITDNKGESLIGVNVKVLGKGSGTITNYDGEYQIQAPINGSLEFSYMGYTSKTENIKNRKNINVVLNEDTKLIDEVVVIGYGAVRKSDLTGSVASVKADELNQSSSNLEQALVGHTPGVQIKQTSGAPGSSSTIRIRGVNSVYGGVEPLYVIDGYPASKDAYINPSDVESIEVLKDAASAAIYGSRASGGVVLIRTKRGSKDRTKIELDYQFSMQQVTKKIKMMNASQFRELHQDGYNNDYFDYLRRNNLYNSDDERWQHSRDDDNTTRAAMGATSTMMLCPDILATDYDTDWQNALFSNAPMHRINFNVSGGREGSKYMFSLGYLDQDGVIAPSNHNRITARLNMDMDLTKRLTLSVNSSMNYIKERTVRADGLAFNDGLILNALGMPPQYPLYNEDGSYATGWSYKNGATSYMMFGGENPVALANEIEQFYTRSRYSLNADLTYKILDGFTAKVNAGTQIQNQIYRYYRPAGNIGQSNNAPGDYANLARARNDRDFTTDWLLEATLNYNKTFDKHTINGVAGYSMQTKIYDNVDTSGQGFTNDRIPEISGAGPTATDENGTSAITDRSAWSLMSFFGRALYNYDNRYTASVTLRSDGCSRFGPENRWGLFPSASLGWNVSNEEFFAPIAHILSTKVRASWGISGNNNISNYRHIPLIKNGSYNFGTGTVPSYYPSGFTDLAIGWEKTQQLNVGLDLSFFNSRLNVIANYYYSVTSDLLYQNTVSAITGSTSYWTNLHDGKVYNNGFDVQVDGALIATKNFKWNLGFNVSLNRNYVEGLKDEIQSIGQRSQITHITKNGLPIGSFYGMVSDGLISPDDYANILIDKANRDNPNYKLVGPAVADYDNVYVGDVKWRDVNNDGKITESDRDVIGNNYPDFNFGINTNFAWKGVTLSATFDGQFGGEVINFARYYTCNNEGANNSMIQGVNRYRGTLTEDYATNENMMYRANRSPKNLNTKFSTFFVEDASFFRCTNLSLGYTIPKNNVFDKLKISRLYIYASVDNLFTLTQYSGYNPDVDYNSGNLTPGIDFGTYPLSRSYSVGLKLNF